MEEKKEPEKLEIQSKINKSEDSEKELLWCEQFKEYVDRKKGCQHPKGYCPYRKQCILYLSLKFKDFD